MLNKNHSTIYEWFIYEKIVNTWKKWRYEKKEKDTMEE